MDGVWWVFGVVAVVLLVATYLTWTAGRVDRLHARVDAAYGALDAHLVRRAAAAAALAGTLAGEAVSLAAAARLALDAPAGEREIAENDLTRQLRVLPLPLDHPALGEVVVASRRAALARQVHTDVVRDALAVRRRKVVRLLRLARKHPMPTYFDVDDPALDAHRRVVA